MSAAPRGPGYPRAVAPALADTPSSPNQNPEPAPGAQTPEPIAFGALLEAAPDAMLIIDPDGRITHVNAQVEALFGFPRDELLGQAMEVLLPERFRGAHPRHRLRYAHEPRRRPMGAAGIELYGRRKDGSEFPAEVSLSPMPVRDRLMVIAAIRDGSARRKSEARISRLMEAAPDGMVLTNHENRIVLVNRQAERLFGYGRGEMLNRPVEMLIPARYRQVHPWIRQKSPDPRPRQASGEGGISLFGLRRDGSEFPAEISLSPLDGENEEGPIAIAAVRDVTEQRKAEAERVKLSQAQEAIRLRDEFLSIASHELRTPLTPIQLQIDGALRAAHRGGKEDLAIVTRKLEALGNGIHRLSSLVNQLLDLSRITAGRLDLERSDVDFVSLVRRSLLAFEDEALSAECLLEFESLRGELRGNWDASRLEQVLTNLLSNALRYGAGRPVSILTGELQPGWITLLIRDQGIGVAPEHQSLIFQRFERVAESRNRGGFGLGLWIVRQIVEAHGGTIGIFSRPGLGSAFGVGLPSLQPPGAARREPVVLLVDDDPAMRENFRNLRSDHDPVGVTAPSGFDALALLNFGLQPQLILLDTDMPGMDGPTFLSELRADVRFRDIPVVWLDDKRAAGAHTSGDELRLVKPFQPGELRALTARHRSHA